MNHIHNKTVIITGASQGIGEATARYLSENGANVVLVARSTDKLNAIVQSIQGAGHNAVAVAGDVADYATLEKAVQTALDHYGAVDTLVNNAGLINPIARLGDSDVSAWANIVDVNLTGVYHGLRAAIPEMLAKDSGTIINISSGAATGAMEGWSHYCSTKAAVLSLTRCAHKEYGGNGIRVVGLSPGTVATDMQAAIRDSGINPVSKLDWSAHIPSQWVAQAIAYLMSDDAVDLAGTDFSIKNDEGRRRAGLPLVSEST